MKYCEEIWKTVRWKTREVKIANVGVGGENPIRIQSMTTSSTRDVDATIDQIISLSDKGCEIARVTVQGKKEAEACEKIKDGLLKRGYAIPLVADIHFYPPAAMMVIDFVDKVRINPGNYLDKRASFKVIEYTDQIYADELERIEEHFTPLVLKCQSLNKPMRIGTNHGSLSDRIMNRYGDTAKGMLESALEYARVCRKLDYHDLIFSMKASNPQIMIQAYRLLVAEMIKLGWDYPLHLGVTEAGEGEDGRVKSSIGIGSLLLDGLGDTIRVSLTENPCLEIDPCKRLRDFATFYQGAGVQPFKEKNRKIDVFHRREVSLPSDLGLHRDGSVALKVRAQDRMMASFYQDLGFLLGPDAYQKTPAAVDMLVVDEERLFEGLQSFNGKIITRKPLGSIHTHQENLSNAEESSYLEALVVSEEKRDEWEKIKDLSPKLILLRPNAFARIHYAREFFEWLQENNLSIPVLLNFTYSSSWEDMVISASVECGSLLCDGLGDGLLLEGPYPLDHLRSLSFAILQGCRMRTVKTEFISCPGCGRTLFDLQKVSKRIRERTEHLPGVKIAIMGCIVNGPGEMADADFGYVGTRPGKIDLYVGKTCVRKNIDDVDADDCLIDLIKEQGRWVEKEELRTSSCVER